MGSPPGRHQEASVSRYAGSTQLVRNVRSHSPGGSSSGGRGSTVPWRPCTLPADALASVSVSPTAQPPEPSATATSASSGAVSSANPARPRATSAPTCWVVPPSIRRSLGGGGQVPLAVDGRRRPGGAGHGEDPRLPDRLPAGAPTEMGGQRPVHGGVIARCHPFGPQPFQTADDPGRAKAALAGARGEERLGPTLAILRREPVDRRDRSGSHPPHRRDARDPRRPVDQHCAAAALALRAAPVFGRAHPEVVAQGHQQRRAVVGHLHRPSVQHKGDGGGQRRRSGVSPAPGEG